VSGAEAVIPEDRIDRVGARFSGLTAQALSIATGCRICWTGNTTGRTAQGVPRPDMNPSLLLRQFMDIKAIGTRLWRKTDPDSLLLNHPDAIEITRRPQVSPRVRWVMLSILGHNRPTFGLGSLNSIVDFRLAFVAARGQHAVEVHDARSDIRYLYCGEQDEPRTRFSYLMVRHIVSDLLLPRITQYVKHEAPGNEYQEPTGLFAVGCLLQDMPEGKVAIIAAPPV